MKGTSIITFLIMILAFSSTVLSKLFEQEYSFAYIRRNKGWIFLQRMKLGKGHAQVRFNSKLIIKETMPTKTYNLQLAVIPDRLWAAQSLMKCSRNSNEVSAIKQKVGDAKQQLLVTTMSPENKFDSGLLQNLLIQQTEVYHFVIRDCEKNILNDYFSRQSRLDIALEIKNNGRDYGEDEQSQFYWFPLLILGTGLMIFFLNTKEIGSESLIEGRYTDYPKMLVAACLWLNLGSLVFKYVGYLIYYFYGVEFSLFDFFYLLLHGIADSVIISIFLFVSFGWTITFIQGQDFDLYVPLVSMIGLISVILTLLNKITDGSHDKYHMYDTIPAYLLVFFKMVTVLIFIGGCIKTFMDKNNAPEIRSIMIKIMVLGGLYLCSVPLIMVIVEYFPPSQRKQWVFIMIELAKNFICFLLTYMISYSKSGYRSVSFEDRSFMTVNGKVL